jgi:hypothetical protein
MTIGASRTEVRMLTGIAPDTMISILAVTLIGAAALLARLPVGTCRECPHCRLEQLAKDREQRLLAERLGDPFCAGCGRHHQPDEDHQF